MRPFLFGLASLLMLLITPTSAHADGCFICKDGSYVKYSGSDNATKRKAAKNCGCEISGTRSSCDAANLKILCSVRREQQEKVNLAQKRHGQPLRGCVLSDRATPG